MKKNILVFLALWFATHTQAQTYHIKTIAGNGTFGYSGDGGAATSAQLATVRGMATDDAGNLYFCDSWKNTVRKIDTNGVITTIAGTGTAGYSGNGGAATAATLNYPKSITVDPEGNIYFTEINNHVVRKIDPAGIITLFASSLAYPNSITNDRHGNLYFSNGYYLYKWHAPGPYTTFAIIPYSEAITIDRTGYLHTLDYSNNRIRKIAPDGTVSFWGGNGGFSSTGNGGPVINAEFAHLYGIAADTNGNIYTAEQNGHVIRKIGLNDTINAFAGQNGPDNAVYPGFSGDNGPAAAAEMNSPWALTTDLKGDVYFYDKANNRIRKIYFYNYAPSFTEGDTVALQACKSAGAYSISSLLAVNDQDTADTLTWTILTTPVHGSLVASFTSVTNGSIVTPSGLTYTPATGFIGTDIFTVRVFDGAEADTITVNVTVNPIPAAITGTLSVCNGNTTTLANTTAGGTWSSGNTSVATIDAGGIVTSVSVGTAAITYMNSVGCPRVATVIVNPVPGTTTGTFIVCAGQTALVSNTVSGGNWTSSNSAVVYTSGASGILLGVSAGTAIITYRLAGGCYTVSTVTVDPLPDAITGTAALCLGSTTILSHPEAGGTWSSSNTARATVDVSTGEVTGVSLGYVTITYRLSAGCYRTIAMTVNPLPGIITGTTTVCTGSTTLLGGSSTNSWTSSNTSVATVGSTSRIVTGVSAGTSQITVQNSAGCYRTTVVTVNESPTAISGTLALCTGTTTVLESIGTTGGTWLSGTTARATIGSSSGIVTGIAAGTSNVTYTWTNSCRSFAVVTVNSIPASAVIGGLSSLPIAATQTLSATQPGGAWTSANTARATVDASSGLMTAMATGPVVISYTQSNSCGTRTNTRIFNITAFKPAAQAIDASGKIAFSLFPNPTLGTITIATDVTGMFTIYTVDGRMVSETKISKFTTSFSLPTSLAAGTYLCRFAGDDGSTRLTRLELMP